ncbi:unnamed protein product, partial [Musa banksii]
MLQHKVEAIGKKLDEPNRQSSEVAGLVFDKMLHLFCWCASQIDQWPNLSHYPVLCW